MHVHAPVGRALPRACTTLESPEPCRFCGEGTWQDDGDGPLHPCCRFWIEQEGQSYCAACRTGRGLQRRQKRFSEARR